MSGDGGLTAGGVVFLACAWGIIGAITFYCFYRIFRTQDRKR